jgi:hypothetical protein
MANQKEVSAVTSSSAENLPKYPATGEHIPAEDLARRQGIKPIASVEDMFRPGTFESDEELDEFLADLYESRRAGMA